MPEASVMSWLVSIKC